MSLPESSSFVPLKREKLDVLLWTKPRPFWHGFMAAACFTIVIYFLYKIVYDPVFSTKYLEEENFARFIILLFGLAILGIGFSLRNYVYFDLAKKKFKDQYGIGKLRVGKW